VWTVFLSIHVTSGSLALLAGPVAMTVPKRSGWHPRTGTWYVALVTALCTSAIGLAILRPAVWWLGIIAAATLAAALAGRQMRRRRPRYWLPWHISLMCGSCISLLTALLVVNLGLGDPIAWILPTVAGSPLIARRAYLAAGRRRTGSRPARGGSGWSSGGA
jgi:hypothetical protein